MTAHDARFAAAMQVHGLPRILTLDRTGLCHPGIEVIHPEEVRV